MARRLTAALLLVMSVCTTNRLDACGDKYLNLGLGTHYNRSAAERRAAGILVYASAGSELSKLLTTLSVEEGLKKVGYQPAIASSSAELDTLLHARKWDVLVVGGPDTPAVAEALSRMTAPPHLVPVLTRPTRDQLKQAEKTYDTVINTPSKSRVFVSVVDDAMDLREIEMRAAAKAAKKATQ